MYGAPVHLGTRRTRGGRCAHDDRGGPHTVVVLREPFASLEGRLNDRRTCTCKVQVLRCVQDDSARAGPSAGTLRHTHPLESLKTRGAHEPRRPFTNRAVGVSGHRWARDGAAFIAHVPYQGGAGDPVRRGRIAYRWQRHSLRVHDAVPGLLPVLPAAQAGVGGAACVDWAPSQSTAICAGCRE
jgi:hypothetical protein